MRLGQKYNYFLVFRPKRQVILTGARAYEYVIIASIVGQILVMTYKANKIRLVKPNSEYSKLAILVNTNGLFSVFKLVSLVCIRRRVPIKYNGSQISIHGKNISTAACFCTQHMYVDECARPERPSRSIGTYHSHHSIGIENQQQQRYISIGVLINW